MKKSNFPYLVFIFVNFAVALSCLFYPVSRDEFYYLDLVNVQNPFLEYGQSYQFGNPRLGQFFCNIISRNTILEVLFGVFLFNAFIAALFLNIYRKLPDFKQVNDLKKFLYVAAFFIFFINYFGEMFYYTPFSSNYTFTHIFYLVYVFVISEYYLHENKNLVRRIPFFAIVIFGIAIGMGNEHVPPVLVGISLLAALIYFLKKKTIPDWNLIILPIFTIIGYAILFFAPANKIKQKTVGKSVLDIGLQDYLANWIRIIKVYFYYNKELILLVVFIVVISIFWNKLLEKIIFAKTEILFWSLMFFLPLVIVGVSPLIDPRLLFFSNSILLIVLFKIMIQIKDFKKIKLPLNFASVFLFIFFGMSMIMTFRARENYRNVISEIAQKSEITKDVELDQKFNYFTAELGTYLNRKIFLESGADYLDQDPLHDTAMEKNLKNYYQLKTLKEK